MSLSLPWLPTKKRLVTLAEDFRSLSALMAEKPWKQQLGEMWVDGEPMMVAGGLAGLEANPPGANLAPLTVTATEAALWPIAYTPISALAVGPKAYYLDAWGLTTTAGTPGTQTFNPRIGTTNAGISMGISSNLTPTASEVAVQWQITGRMILRNPGTTAAVATGAFRYVQTTGTTGNAAETSPLWFGGVSASVDNTAAQNLFMGATAATSVTNTMTPQGVIWGSWN